MSVGCRAQASPGEHLEFRPVEGIAQGEQIIWWTAGLIPTGDVPVQVWIDTNTFLIHRVHLVELASDPERPTEWDIRFSDFDQPLDIQARVKKA